MIVVRTPLRISFVGGGSDFPDYFRAHGGAVLSTAIDKYVYVIVKERFDDQIYINYSRKEIVDSVADIQHELVREAMRITGVDRGVEITTLADVPSSGTGLGSSSSITVGLLQALYAYKGVLVTAEQLAQQACEIEIERCKKPIGKQDQYIAAFGGLRVIQFHPDNSVAVQSVDCGEAVRQQLNRELLLFYTDVTRIAGGVLQEQQQNILARRDELAEIAALVEPGRVCICGGDCGQGRARHRRTAVRCQNMGRGRGRAHPVLMPACGGKSVSSAKSKIRQDKRKHRCQSPRWGTVGEPSGLGLRSQREVRRRHRWTPQPPRVARACSLLRP